MKKRHIFISLLLVLTMLTTSTVALTGCVSEEKKQDPVVPQVTLKSLEVSGGKRTFFIGDKFETGDLVVTANYTDDTTKDVTSLAKIDSSKVKLDTLGTYNVIVKYGEKSTSYSVTVVNVALQDIILSDEKTTFSVGDTFSVGNLKVTAEYNNKDKVDVTSEADVDSSQVDMTKAGTYTVTVTYGGKTKGYTIKVELPVLDLSGIEVSGAKTSFFVGEEFTKGDLVVTAKFSDDSTSDVTGDATIDSSQVNMAEAGTYTVTVTYGGKTKTYDVEVVAVALDDIEVSGAKTSFFVGEAFTKDDLVVTAKYNNNTTATVTSNATVDSSQVNVAEAGTYTVTVTYGGKTKTYTVTYAAATPHNVTYDANGHGTSTTVQLAKLPLELPQLNDVPYSFGGKYVFGGWYTDAKCTDGNEVVGDTFVAADVTFYAKWTKENLHIPTEDDVEVGYKLHTVTLDVANLAVGKYNGVDNTYNDGVFSIPNDNSSEVRGRTKKWTNPDNPAEEISFTKSIKLGAASTALNVEVKGTGVLVFYAQCGSSGCDTKPLKITYPNGSSKTITIPGPNKGVEDYSSGSPVVRIAMEVEEGKYSIARGDGTIDIYYAELTIIVTDEAETGFSIIDNGLVDYLIGQEYDSSKIVVHAIFGENVRTELIPLNSSDLHINSNEFDKTQAGEYEISVQYKQYPAKTITVNVHAAEQIVLGFNAITQGKNSYNSIYVNNTVKRVYKLNEQFDKANLTIKAIADNEEYPLSLQSDVRIEGFDSTTPGTKIIKVVLLKDESIFETFDVYVVDVAPSIVNETIQIMVNKEYSGVIGSVVSGFNMFTTIQSALDYLKSLQDVNDVKKLIKLAPGTYTEKLEINIPYLTIDGGSKDTTKIEWDSLYGVKDESGFANVTDSTQTVAVREAAVGVTFKNVTISNAWNNRDKYISTGQYGALDGKNASEHRALALLVQADMFKMSDCALLGMQDTVEFFTGRQLIERTLIQGTTDFIFGTNNTTYFDECVIKVVTSEQKSNGGYYTAFKGINSSDYVNYGAIFNNCLFTAEADVPNGSCVLARPWGTHSAVIIMNCELDACVATNTSVSTQKPSGSTPASRYYNGLTPINHNMKFAEFDNTGAGAMSEENLAKILIGTDDKEYQNQRLVKTLTLEEAILAGYYKKNGTGQVPTEPNFTTIFGTSNGTLIFKQAWNPTKEEIVVDQSIHYMFNGEASATGTSYVYDKTTLNSENPTLTFAGLTLDATHGNIAFNANSGKTNFKSGATITFDVVGGTQVTINTHPGYCFLSINGVEAVSSGSIFVKYFEENTTVVITSTGDLYVASIDVDPAAEAPTPATLVELVLVGTPTAPFAIGDNLDLSDLVVRARYSDNSIVTLTSDNYTMDDDNFDKNVAKVYTFTVTYGGIDKKFTVEYVDAVDNVVRETTGWTFKGTTYTGENVKTIATVDATSKDVIIDKLTVHGTKDNGTSNWLKFGTGAALYLDISDACTLNIYFYQGVNNATVIFTVVGGTASEISVNSENGSSDQKKYSYVISGEGKVEIVANANGGYIGYLEVVYPEPVVEETTGWTFKGTTYTGENVKTIATVDATSSDVVIDKLTVHGTKDNGTSNWLNFGTGAALSLNVLSACTLNICFYNGVNNATVTFTPTDGNGAVVTTTTSSADASYSTKYAYTITGEGKIEIVANANGGYIGYLEVIFA